MVKSRTAPTAPDDSLTATRAILDLVRRGQARSRSEIIELTGLSRAVVAQRVRDLLELGLLSESVADSTGGRPPRRLEFRADAGHLLVADVGATSIDVARADLSGNVLEHASEAVQVDDGPKAVLGTVQQMFERLGADSTMGAPLWGIGLGLPGPVEFRTGRPASPPIMPGWDGFPVREYFSDRYGAPVWVDNDVNIMTLGEWRGGVARGHDHVVFVKVGTGIGAGIISEGTLHRGAQGSAGDIGHVQVTDGTGQVCRCGKLDCLEALAGGGALGRDGEALAASGKSERLAQLREASGAITAREVQQAASMGDPGSVDLLHHSGRLIGTTLAGLVNFFNPSLIVIGGGVANAGDSYLAAIRQVIYARSAPLATRDLLVQLSALGDRAGVIGAASMVLDELFSQRYLGRWIGHGHPDERTVRVSEYRRTAY